MAEPNGAAPPTWTRWVPGSSILAFFLLSGGLWLACLVAWEVRQPELVVILLALGAVLPLLGLAVRLRIRPLWALQVHEDRRRVGDVLLDALRDRQPMTIVPNEARYAGFWRDCEPLLRIEDPACLLGVRRSPEPWTTLLLLPESTDRAALDGLRAMIASRVISPG